MAYMTADDVQQIIDVSDFSSTQIDRQIAEFEEVAEDYIGWAYQARTVTDEQNLIDYGTLKLATTNNWWPAFVKLKHRYVTAISSVTIEGTTIDSANYQIDVTGKYLLFAPWIVSSILGPKYGRVKITYTHGLTTVPTRLQRACALYVRGTLRSDASGMSRDVLTQAVDGATTRYATPSKAEKRPTGFLEVDRLINSVVGSSRLPTVA